MVFNIVVHRIISIASEGPRTSNLNIIPLSMCSAMWQCAIHRPGLVASKRMCTTSPARTRTVSFYTRFSSGAPPRSRTRKRPAPWVWNGWCIWWSAPAELSRRILTRSPTCSVQEISLLAAPVAVSTTFHTMLDRFDMTFISGIVSSHSMWSSAAGGGIE